MDASPARAESPAGPAAGPRNPPREWRLGPLRLRLFPADHPTADIEIAAAVVGLLALAALPFVPLATLAR